MSRLTPIASFIALWIWLCACADGPDDTGPGRDASVGIDSRAIAIDAPGAADDPTWASFAESFFETYCYACHGPGDGSRDYSVLEQVRAEAAAIRCGVSPIALDGCSIPATQFPVGSGAKPSDDERTRLVEWIDSGMPE